MVALKTERRVYMWRATPTVVPKEAPNNATLDEIIAILSEAYSAKQAEIYLSDSGRVLPPDAPADQKDRKNRVYIADLMDEPSCITMLINRGDPLAADPAFINATSGEVHPVIPGEDESQGWSAHLVISKIETGGIYRACFERMPHSTSSYAEMLIRTLLDRYAATRSEYTYQKRLRRGRRIALETRRYRPNLTVKKVPSEQLKADLEHGELSTITLINSKVTYSGPDAPDVVRDVKNKLVIRVKRTEQRRIVEYIEHLTPWARARDYDAIQFNIVKLPGNTSANPRFFLDIEDATETLYVRSQRLTGFGHFLDCCYANIAPDIKEKMAIIPFA